MLLTAHSIARCRMQRSKKASLVFPELMTVTALWLSQCTQTDLFARSEAQRRTAKRTLYSSY